MPKSEVANPSSARRRMIIHVSLDDHHEKLCSRGGGAEVKHQIETKIEVILKKSVSEWSETSDFSNILV